MVGPITEEMLEQAEATEGEEMIDILRRLQLNSVACVPIAIGRRVIGTLTLARSAPDPELDLADVDVLGAVADRAAAALENAGLYQQQREIAETLQAVLTPKSLPRVPGFQWATAISRCRWSGMSVVTSQPSSPQPMVGPPFSVGVGGQERVSRRPRPSDWPDTP